MGNALDYVNRVVDRSVPCFVFASKVNANYDAGFRHFELNLDLRSQMQALMQAIFDAVMEFYDYSKPWKQDFVKFTIEFDEQGRVAAITYTPFPAEYKDALLERVRDVCQP